MDIQKIAPVVEEKILQEYPKTLHTLEEDIPTIEEEFNKPQTSYIIKHKKQNKRHEKSWK